MSLNRLLSKVAGASTSAGRLVGLIEREISKPLLVMDTEVESYVRSLLVLGRDKANDVTPIIAGDGVIVRSSNSVTVTTHTESGVAILDISGPLTNREVNYPCAASPVSYQAIRSEITAAVSDIRIKTIIARIDSGGGVASNMVDLADFIRKTVAENPQVRFIASIDDMACSAAFGIAASFPERYISRTGLAGSVGVVVRHSDYSVANAEQGVTHTYIYAGANKVLGNSDEPLSEAAKSSIANRVGQHYDLFAESVAKGLGVDVETVKATEASVYQGKEAVDIGFATGIMTFTEIIQSLEKTGMDEQDIKPDAAVGTESSVVAVNAQAPVPTEAQVETDKANAARKAGIEAICAMGNVDSVKTAALVASSVSVDSVAAMVAAMSATGSDINTQSAQLMKGEETEAEKEAKLVTSWINVLK